MKMICRKCKRLLGKEKKLLVCINVFCVLYDLYQRGTPKFTKVSK